MPLRGNRWPDAPPADDRGAVIQNDLRSGALEVLARFRNADCSQTTGCHPHPVYSRDDRRIYFNAAEDGYTKLFLVDLDTA